MWEMMEIIKVMSYYLAVSRRVDLTWRRSVADLYIVLKSSLTGLLPKESLVPRSLDYIQSFYAQIICIIVVEVIVIEV